MARSTWECPFVPGAGKIPGVWAGRNLELADAEASGARRLSGVYDRGRAVLGEFGIGKSVLLNRIGQDLELAGHWVAGTLRVTHGDDPLPRLAGLLRDLVDAHSLAGVLGRRAGGFSTASTRSPCPSSGAGSSSRAARPIRSRRSPTCCGTSVAWRARRVGSCWSASMRSRTPTPPRCRAC